MVVTRFAGVSFRYFLFNTVLFQQNLINASTTTITVGEPIEFKTLATKHGISLEDYTESELVAFESNFKRHSNEPKQGDELKSESISDGVQKPFINSDSSSDYIKNLLLDSRPVSTQKELDDLKNDKSLTWTPIENITSDSRFAALSVRDTKRMMGTFLPGDPGYVEPTNIQRITKNDFSKDELEKSKILKNFDSREKWGKICPMIGHSRDQGSCGSCWAHGSTEAYNDRICITSNGKINTTLSTQHTTSCCSILEGCLSFGCEGGNPLVAWLWLTRHGVVTGKDYDDIGKDDSCWPYELPFCSHHVKHGTYPACKGDFHIAPSCKSECINKKSGYSKEFKDDMSKAGGWPVVVEGDDAIRAELFKNGPMTAAMVLFNDFLKYKGGIYRRSSGSYPIGGHAVKIIGYGEEEVKDEVIEYWIVMNSWNPTWGLKGAFKIAKHQSLIDRLVIAGRGIHDYDNVKRENPPEVVPTNVASSEVYI